MAIFDEFPYTNFHDKNLDGMCKAIGKNREDIDKNTEQISILKGRMLIAEQQIDQHANQIADLAGKVARNTTELDLVHHMADNHESEISQIHVDLQDHEERITALEQGGGGGGGAWTHATLMTDEPRNTVAFDYNLTTGQVIFPDCSQLTLNFTVTGSIHGIGGIDIPNGYIIEFVMPMVLAGRSTEPGNAMVAWRIGKASDGTLINRAVCLSWAQQAVNYTVAVTGISYPLFGVIKAIN